MTTRVLTFRAISWAPVSGLIASAGELSRSARLPRKPCDAMTTLPSGCAASARRYISTAGTGAGVDAGASCAHGVAKLASPDDERLLGIAVPIGTVAEP